MKTLDTHDGIGEAVRLTLDGKAHNLSDALTEQVARILFVKDKTLLREDRSTIIRLLKEEFNVSTSTAYADFALAKKYLQLGSLIDQRDVHVSILFDNLAEAREKILASSDPDFRALAALEKVYAWSIKEFTGNKEAIDWSQVNLPVPVLIFDPKLIGSKVSAEIEEFTVIQERYRKQILNKKAVKKLPETPYDEAQ